MLLLVFVLLIISIWAYGFYFINDFSLPTVSIKPFKKVLFVFAHPDDEIMSCGGLIQELVKQGSQVKIIFLTEGERGTPDASLDDGLRSIRKKEALTVAELLGVQEVEIKNFGDGEVANHRPGAQKYVREEMGKFQPDLVVTFDKAGLYGHPDHMATSEIVTDLLINDFSKSKLWYTAYPPRLLDMMYLPEHMANDPLFKDKRARPNIKVAGGRGFWTKAQGVRAYKSQWAGLVKSFPFPALPVEFYSSLQQFEYFEQIR